MTHLATGYHEDHMKQLEAEPLICQTKRKKPPTMEKINFAIIFLGTVLLFSWIIYVLDTFGLVLPQQW